jgi:hypothetical protein
MNETEATSKALDCVDPFIGVDGPRPCSVALIIPMVSCVSVRMQHVPIEPYDGVKHGANVNLLTKNTHRDRVAATPLHRYVPCRLDS